MDIAMKVVFYLSYCCVVLIEHFDFEKEPKTANTIYWHGMFLLGLTFGLSVTA